MIPRTHTIAAAHRIAERMRNFRRPGTSGWSTTVDTDHARTSHEFMIASQYQQHNRSI